MTAFLDSEHVVLGITEWITKWRRQNFKKGGADRLNADLWRTLDASVAPGKATQRAALPLLREA